MMKKSKEIKQPAREKNVLASDNADIEERVIVVGGEFALLDADVAAFYQVETREINQAVKNNPNKFPSGYVLELDKSVGNEPIKIFDRLPNLKHSTVPPKVFTEKGLYMLATILKGERAVKTTIKIIETFARFKDVTKALDKANNTRDLSKKAELLQNGGVVLADLITDDLKIAGENTRTKFTIDLGIMKIEREVEKIRRKK
jgi:hypothetical protein